MAWSIKGTYFETCSCELMCPCNLSMDHGATYDFCRVTMVFDIREGQVDGTDVAGLKVAAIADTPKVMTEGNWRIGVFVDEQATDEQADKLVAVFSGQLGGPMAALGPLWAGAMYERVAPGAPYWMGAVILVAAALVLAPVKARAAAGQSHATVVEQAY